MNIDYEGLKSERVQFEEAFEERGWTVIKEVSRKVRSTRPILTGAWTAYELADHYEACELVPLIGEVAELCHVQPEVDVRKNIVFVTIRNDYGAAQTELDFAIALDAEVGLGLKARGLLGPSDEQSPFADPDTDPKGELS